MLATILGGQAASRWLLSRFHSASGTSSPTHPLRTLLVSRTHAGGTSARVPCRGCIIRLGGPSWPSFFNPGLFGRVVSDAFFFFLSLCSFDSPALCLGGGGGGGGESGVSGTLSSGPGCACWIARGTSR